jgi:hypothetical protein
MFRMPRCRWEVVREVVRGVVRAVDSVAVDSILGDRKV